MIDASRRIPVPSGIFVIWDGLGLVTKRIAHMPYSDLLRVTLKSANPECDSYEWLADDIRIVGRAVWVTRRLNAWPHAGDVAVRGAARHGLCLD